MLTKSNYLVHWTGKDINTNKDKLSEEDRDRYVDRFTSIIETGFWMKDIQEEVWGGHPTEVNRSSGIAQSYIVPATCFTENRMTKASIHSEMYGLLGVAVEREYVLKRYGAPVWYVRNHVEERITATLLNLRYYIHSNADRTPEGYTARRNIDQLGVFLKAMSSSRNSDDFKYLDESEWRVIFRRELLSEGLIVERTIEGIIRRIMPVSIDDIRLIVVPDDIVRNKLTSRHNMRDRPPVLTIDECNNM